MSTPAQSRRSERRGSQHPEKPADRGGARASWPAREVVGFTVLAADASPQRLGQLFSKPDVEARRGQMAGRVAAASSSSPGEHRPSKAAAVLGRTSTGAALEEVSEENLRKCRFNHV
jgi:hypothetical protein